ncbi:Bromodomain and WD repeat-containing protein, partial [Dirofilaria immitis]
TKDDDVLYDGKGKAEIDDDPLSDCSWNMRANSTKKNKNHRKRTCGSQENVEINRNRRRQVALKKFRHDAESYSINEQDPRMTRTYVTRNRQGHPKHTAAQANCEGHSRIRLRRSVQRNNHWWTGTIDKKEVHDEENYPRSNWYCLTVRWDTGEDEKMSPWDVQPQQPNRRSGVISNFILYYF